MNGTVVTKITPLLCVSFTNCSGTIKSYKMISVWDNLMLTSSTYKRRCTWTWSNPLILS